MADSPVLVPSDRRKELLKNITELLIQSSHGDDWLHADDSQRRMLTTFLEDKYDGAPALSWMYSSDIRIGYNRCGTYIHQDHHKRYFGLPRGVGSVLLTQKTAEPVPVFHAPVVGRPVHPDLRVKLANSIMTVSDDLRHEIMHGTFAGADVNDNGFLSRPEVATMMRRLIGTISSEDVETLMEEAKAHQHLQVNYKEFTAWMKSKAPCKVVEAFKSNLSTGPCVVRASFRIWDRNGNGLIKRGEVYKLLHGMDPNQYTKKRVEVLFKVMDADHGGSIDYDEFVDFLFFRR